MQRADRDEFLRKGFVVARGFFTEAEVGALLSEVERCSSLPGTQDSLTDGGMVFTANVFKHSTVVQELLSSQRVLDFLRPVAGDDLWVKWDQAVTKQPGAGVFRWHQDNGYNRLLTEHFQLWVALTESRNQNGALWLAPGSHKRGLLPHNRKAASQMEVTEDVGDVECIDATAGDVILFSSLLLHKTGPNLSPFSRVAYVAEYMPCSDFDYSQRNDGPFFIAGHEGRPAAKWVGRQPGSASIRNQLLYWRPRVREMWHLAKAPARALKRVLRLGALMICAATMLPLLTGSRSVLQVSVQRIDYRVAQHLMNRSSRRVQF